MIADIDKARSQLINQVLDATTLPQVKAAQRALSAWIKDHPEEQGMRDGFEQLSLMEDIAEMEAAGLLAEEQPPDLAACDPHQGRKWLVSQVAKATTLPEIAAARTALRQWATAHPQDNIQRDLDHLALLLDLAQEQEAAHRRNAPAQAQYTA